MLKFSLIVATIILSNAMVIALADRNIEEERLSFQSGGPWSPRVNLNADVAMVYGIGPKLPETMQTWREQGYRIHVMTGVAWGEYQDYLDGRFDGTKHWDEAQTDSKGEYILHGGSKSVP